MSRVWFASAVIALGIFVGACSQQSFLLGPAELLYQAKITWNSKVDILWVIDNTPSMAQHQNILAQRAPDFLNGLLARGLDFKIAATTVDMRSGGNRGAFIGSPAVISPSTPNIMNAFLNKLVVGEVNYDLEQGLDAMRSAIELRNSTNSGFFRSDAFLVVIFVSNEDDGSPNSSANYINYLDSVKPPTPVGDRNWVAQFIGVTNASGENCSTYGNYTEAGYRYMDLVNVSKGTSSTICTGDFKSALSGVERRIYEISSKFYLDRKPVDGSIVVSVNGQTIPEDSANGWTYSAIDNSIQLHGSSVVRAVVPVKIYYQPTEAK